MFAPVCYLGVILTPFPDLWHEKRQSILPFSQGAPRSTGITVDCHYGLLMRLVVRKKELKPKSTSNKSNRKPPKPKLQSKRRKKPRKRSERRRRPPRKHWRERQRIYSSLYRFKKWHLAWIQRRCCAYFTSRVIVRKEGSVNLAMIQQWSEKERRKICIRIHGKIKTRPRRRMIWLIGMRVGRSKKRSHIFLIVLKVILTR